MCGPRSRSHARTGRPGKALFLPASGDRRRHGTTRIQRRFPRPWAAEPRPRCRMGWQTMWRRAEERLASQETESVEARERIAAHTPTALGQGWFPTPGDAEKVVSSLISSRIDGYLG